VLARSMDGSARRAFEYGSGTIHLGVVALTRACGMRTSELATATFSGRSAWHRAAGEIDHQGFSNGGAGLYLTPRDMQEIGPPRAARRCPPAAPDRVRLYVASMTSARSPPAGHGDAALRIRVVGGADRGVRLHARQWLGRPVHPGRSAKRLVVTTAALTTGCRARPQWPSGSGIFDILMLRIVPAFWSMGRPDSARMGDVLA